MILMSCWGGEICVEHQRLEVLRQKRQLLPTHPFRITKIPDCWKCVLGDTNASSWVDKSDGDFKFTKFLIAKFPMCHRLECGLATNNRENWHDGKGSDSQRTKCDIVKYFLKLRFKCALNSSNWNDWGHREYDVSQRTMLWISRFLINQGNKLAYQSLISYPPIFETGNSTRPNGEGARVKKCPSIPPSREQRTYSPIKLRRDCELEWHRQWHSRLEIRIREW